MSAHQSRDYLAALTETEAGIEILRDLGYGAIIDSPRRGDDHGSVLVATAALAEFRRRYPAVA
jgi:hypothetical protein